VCVYIYIYKRGFGSDIMCSTFLLFFSRILFFLCKCFSYYLGGASLQSSLILNIFKKFINMDNSKIMLLFIFVYLVAFCSLDYCCP
jgi:hypothetical protein